MVWEHSPTVQADAAVVAEGSPIIPADSSVIRERSSGIEASSATAGECSSVIEERSAKVQAGSPTAAASASIVREPAAGVAQRACVTEERLSLATNAESFVCVAWLALWAWRARREVSPGRLRG